MNEQKKMGAPSCATPKTQLDSNITVNNGNASFFLTSSKKNNKFLKLPLDLLQNGQLSHTEIIVLSVLNFYNFRGSCYPSIETIATLINRSNSTVKKALYKLRNLGFIQWSLSQYRTYEINDKPKTDTQKTKNGSETLYHIYKKSNKAEAAVDIPETETAADIHNKEVLQKLSGRCITCNHCKSIGSTENITYLCDVGDKLSEFTAPPINCNHYTQGTTYLVLTEIERGLTKCDRGKAVISAIEANRYPYEQGKLTINYNANKIKQILRSYNRNIPSGKRLNQQQQIRAINIIVKDKLKLKGYLSYLQAACENIATAFNRNEFYFNIFYLLKNNDKMLKLARGQYSNR